MAKEIKFDKCYLITRPRQYNVGGVTFTVTPVYDGKQGVDIKKYDVFYNGEQLVEVYKEHSANYDVSFLDIEMEKLNGIETANTIREFDEHVIIIFITRM